MFRKILKILLHFFLFYATCKRIEVSAKYIIPQNSCPDYFKYVNYENEIEGRIELNFRIKDSDIVVVFEGSIPELLTDVSYRNKITCKNP